MRHHDFWHPILTTIHGIHIRKETHTGQYMGSDGKNYTGKKVLFNTDGTLMSLLCDGQSKSVKVG